MPEYEFQIKTQTEEEADAFMAAIGANDVDLEPWVYEEGTANEYEECNAFGVTTLTPQELEAKAAEYQVNLIYVESVEEADQKADALIQQVIQASEMVYSREPTPGKTRLGDMLETYKQISDEMEM